MANPVIAVNSNGLVTLRRKGTAVVKVSSKNINGYQIRYSTKQSMKASVKVKK